MTGFFLVGAWLATYWIHATILSLAALGFARWVGIRHCEWRDAAWKAALVGGVFTASLHFALPGIGWGSVLMLPESAIRSPQVGSARKDHSLSNARMIQEKSLQPFEPSQTADPSLLESVTWPGLSDTMRFACTSLSIAFAVGALIGLLRFGFANGFLWRLAARARPCEQVDLLAVLDQHRLRLGIRSAVDLLVSEELAGPLATGIWRPRVIVPAVALDGRLDALQLEGFLAHELAHHARRDPLWAVLGHLIVHAFWFQPLGHIVRRNMRMDAELLADALACRTLGGGLELARCLATMAEWLVPRTDRRLEIGGVHFFARRASLKQRVESLLTGSVQLAPQTLFRRWLVRTVSVGILVLLLAAAPVVKTEDPTLPTSGESEVNRTLVALTLAAAVVAPAIAEEPKAGGQESRETAAEPKVPVTVHGFSGEVVGTIVSKDTDGASLVLKVQKVTNVWKNSKAEQPRDLVGRTVPIEKFFGRFLDVLLVVKPGDTVMVEVKHVRGDQLQFLGELFKKVDPISSPETPKVDRPDRPAKPATDKPADEPKTAGTTELDQGKIPAGLQGFRGILLGKVVKTDVEKGVLIFQAESVKRTWPQNKATNPASSKGKDITVNGITGKWLDVLLVLKPGDRVEVEAFHNRGEALDFVQEWLKKVD